MVGITKEAKMICEWMKRENKLLTFNMSKAHELEEARLIQIRTLDVMISILQESFPSSKEEWQSCCEWGMQTTRSLSIERSGKEGVKILIGRLKLAETKMFVMGL